MADHRFVILCLARTGSSHLVDLLDSHPAIRCYGEVLNETHRGAAPSGWIGDSGHSDAAVHVSELLRSGPATATATGFKLPLNSIRDHPEIVGWLEGDLKVEVIRLKRLNSLALLVSRRLLQATLVSQSVYGSYGDRRVRIDPAAAAQALERIEAEDTELDRLAEHHRTLEMVYERLDDDAELAGLQRFLGVANAPLSSRYERLRTRRLSAHVENWEELSSSLSGTRFEPMLDEPDRARDG